MVKTHVRTFDLEGAGYDFESIELYIVHLNGDSENLDPDSASTEFYARYLDEWDEIVYESRFSSYPDLEDLVNA